MMLRDSEAAWAAALAVLLKHAQESERASRETCQRLEYRREQNVEHQGSKRESNRREAGKRKSSERGTARSRND